MKTLKRMIMPTLCAQTAITQQNLGYSGHVGLVIGVNVENNELIILNYNRDIEGQNLEGFGLERKSFTMSNNIKKLFFRLR